MILFKKWGWFFLPSSTMAWAVLLLTLALNVWFFVVIDLHSHSVSDSLINFFPYSCSFWWLYGWLAANNTLSHS